MNSTFDDLKLVQSLDPAPQNVDANTPEARRMLLATLAADRQIDAERTQQNRPRRTRIALAGLAGVAVLGSGAAVAAGIVPQFVTDAFDKLDASAPQEFDVTGIKPIADFALPDGTQYTVWRGRNNAGGSCEAIKEDRPGTEHDNLQANCFDGESKAHYEQVTFNQVQLPEEPGENQNPMYFVAYGEAPSTDAARVRVVGDGTDITMTVDPNTHGFGGNLPNLTPPPDGQLVELDFTFVDAVGHQVGRAALNK
jgi:hypothetical protein